VIAAARAALRSLQDLDAAVEARVLGWLRQTDSVNLDTITLGQLLGVSTNQAGRIADALTAHDVFERREILVCTHDGCGIALNEESLAEQRCRTCGADLDDYPPRRELRYVLERPRSRDVGWLIALHGIGTLGRWQEQLQWLIDREFRRTIPFRNWKYGRILLGALVPALQRRFVRRFITEVREAHTGLQGVLRNGAAPAPDVIAHSFGTWIVAHALETDQSLQLGHLVLVGSIVRPDWLWAGPLERGQVRAILNYCGDQDPWVRLAERFIPDSGPSGGIGFTQQHERLTNILRAGGTHSSAFTPELLDPTFEDVWRPFLANRGDEIDTAEHQILGPPQWSRAAAIWRAPSTTLLALGFLGAAFAAVAIWS
jgi:hypothetical protein